MNSPARTPNDWRLARLDDVCDVILGQSPPGKTYNSEGIGLPFFQGKAEFGDVYPKVVKWCTEPAKIAEKGDVLISVRAPVGPTNLCPERACIGRGLAALRPRDGIPSRYVLYAVRSNVNSLAEKATGSTFDAISGSQLRAHTIALAPFKERQPIVGRIEKQFTRLDAGVSSLQQVQTALKRYRASVLKAACEGRLVPTEAELSCKENRSYETGEHLLQRILKERREKWNGKGKYKEPSSPNIVDLPQLPEGWAWATLEQLNLANRPCAYGVLQPGSDVISGIPFVRVGDIHDGKIDTRNLKRISAKIAAQYPRTNLQGSEFVITLVGAIGRTAIVPESLRGGNTARAVGIVPLSAYVNAHWVELWFRNPQKTAEMISKAHEVARKTLNLEDVRVATVALPPLAEQSRIVAEVDRRFSIVEELQALIDVNCNRADRLRRATLQQAFAGGETSSRARRTTATF